MICYQEGVKFRCIDEKDLPQLFSWRNDYRVWEWCRQYEPLHWKDHLAWYERQVSDKSISMFAVLTDSDELIGVCGFTDIDMVNRRAEFSLYIDPDLVGRGYGKGALNTLFRHGFERLGLNLIWGETFEKNAASYLFEAIGMTRDGVRRQFYFRNGKYIDAHLYSITKAQLR